MTHATPSVSQQEVVERQALTADPDQSAIVNTVDSLRELVPCSRARNGRRRCGDLRFEVKGEWLGLDFGIDLC